MIKQKNKWKFDLIFEQWMKIWSTSLKSCLGFFKKKMSFFVTIIWNMSLFSFFTCILSLFSVLFTRAGNFPSCYQAIGHAKPVFYCFITANPLVTCWWSATFKLSDLLNLSYLWKWRVLKRLLTNPLLPVKTHPWPSVVFWYQIWPKMVDNWPILPPACHIWTDLRYRSYPLFLISKQLFWSVLIIASNWKLYIWTKFYLRVLLPVREENISQVHRDYIERVTVLEEAWRRFKKPSSASSKHLSEELLLLPVVLCLEDLKSISVTERSCRELCNNHLQIWQSKVRILILQFISFDILSVISPFPHNLFTLGGRWHVTYSFDCWERQLFSRVFSLLLSLFLSLSFLFFSFFYLFLPLLWLFQKRRKNPVVFSLTQNTAVR